MKLLKIYRVIDSCNTLDQFLATARWLKQLVQREIVGSIDALDMLNYFDSKFNLFIGIK